MAVSPLLEEYGHLLKDDGLDGLVLDLACGAGDNGLYLADLNLPVVLADRSSEALATAREKARQRELEALFWEIDLETDENPLPTEFYRGVIVFRYLHRPLIPHLRRAVRPGGIIIYETFTSEQPRYGRPTNPDFLLRPGELAGWFEGWETIHYFEGILEDPLRAMAQIVCRKPKAEGPPGTGGGCV